MDGRIDRVIYPKVVMADNNKILVSQSVGLVHHYIVAILIVPSINTILSVP